MPHTITTRQILDLEAVLSPPRFGTYLRETGGDRHKAMELYCWNTDVSAAFYVMLQFCELSIRNGAVEAIESVFGQNWHLNRGFAYTLPVLRVGAATNREMIFERARRVYRLLAKWWRS